MKPFNGWRVFIRDGHCTARVVIFHISVLMVNVIAVLGEDLIEARGATECFVQSMLTAGNSIVKIGNKLLPALDETLHLRINLRAILQLREPKDDEREALQRMEIIFPDVSPFAVKPSELDRIVREGEGEFDLVSDIHKVELLRKVVLYIWQNISGSLHIDSIAKEFATTQHLLEVLFRAHTGLTLHEYIIKTRMENARRIIEETSIPLSEIGYVLGYADASSFSRAIHTYWGTNASDLRKKANERKKMITEKRFRGAT